MSGLGRKFYKRTIRKAPLKRKTVLLRVDYNVPIKDGKILDDFRIRSSLPTIQKLLDDGCRVVIISHLGRPNGDHIEDLSLEPTAQRLAEMVKKPVRFVDDCVGYKVKMAVKKTPHGSIVMLENLRFYFEEESNNAEFAKKIAQDSGADYFVQDGFGVVHRAHASTSAITQFLPSVAGLLLEKEWLALNSVVYNPKRPLLAILGGAKVSDKIEVIDSLVKVADQIVVGGAMANTFLSAKGIPMGKSRVEKDAKEIVSRIYNDIDRKVTRNMRDNFFVLPDDLAVAKQVDKSEKRSEVDVHNVAADDLALDIGSRSIDRLNSAIESASTILWNGTLGMAELPEFSLASREITEKLTTSKNKNTVVGGGDTVDFVLEQPSRGAGLTHISTGGGASIELMSGKKLPGIESLLDA